MKLSNLSSEGQRVVKAYANVFNTPDGKIVLQDLTDAIGTRLIDEKEHITVYNVGRRDVVDYINECIKVGRDGLEK